MKVGCPTCGAEVEFRYDDSFVRVCDSCQAAVVRGDRGVETLGKVADLVPTASPLALFADGRWAGQGFILVGRAQYQHPAGGVWDEWYAKLDDGRWGWLAEAQGRFYLTFETVGAGELPWWSHVFPGATVPLEDDGPRLYTVGERGIATLAGARGEIPFRFEPGRRFAFADLADGHGRFATIDYGDPDDTDASDRAIYLGRQVTLAELGLRGGEAEVDAAAPQAGRRLSCPSCGGAIELRAPGQSMRVVCGYCSTLLACEGELAILAQLEPDADPAHVPLGSVGRFDDVDFTVVGRIRRATHGDGFFAWNEYLLYAPAAGFRWLVESDGHWTFVTTLPPGSVDVRTHAPRYDGRTFRLYDEGTAVVQRVWGECYWRVEVGETVTTADYVAPPAMLSVETSATEINVSLGLYLSAAEVDRAFGGKLELPAPSGVAPAQPFKHKRITVALGLVAVALVAAIVARGALASNRTAYQADLVLQEPPAEALAEAGVTGDHRLVFSDSFELAGRKNVEIQLRADVHNSWIFVAGDLIHEDSGQLQTFEQEIGYYSGVDGGEAWSEGRRSARVYFPAVAPGRYLLRLEVQQAPGSNITAVGVTVRQGVLRGRHVLIAALAVGLPGLVLGLWYWWFERRRWSNSDHAPTGLGSSE
ncbi:MAG: DUF4178 domain-containing protein [Kofleriaceae bacterium]